MSCIFPDMFVSATEGNVIFLIVLARSFNWLSNCSNETFACLKNIFKIGKRTWRKHPVLKRLCETQGGRSFDRLKPPILFNVLWYTYNIHVISYRKLFKNYAQKRVDEREELFVMAMTNATIIDTWQLVSYSLFIKKLLNKLKLCFAVYFVNDGPSHLLKSALYILRHLNNLIYLNLS